MTVATALDRLPRPPCADLLGWQVVDARPAEGWTRIRFEARPAFLIRRGGLSWLKAVRIRRA